MIFYFINSLEKLYSSRRNRSLQETKIQKEKVLEWLIEDKKFLYNEITIKELDKFLSADFELFDMSNEKCLRSVKEWFKILNQNKDNNVNNINKSLNPFNGNMGTQNVILKNKILKLETPNFNLRSLAILVEVNFLMAGESSFYIMTRGENNYSKEMAVCCINKELESSRKFINFSILEPDDDNFLIKTLKKQEIPKQGIYFSNY